MGNSAVATPDHESGETNHLIRDPGNKIGLVMPRLSHPISRSHQQSTTLLSNPKITSIRLKTISPGLSQLLPTKSHKP